MTNSSDEADADDLTTRPRAAYLFQKNQILPYTMSKKQSLRKNLTLIDLAKRKQFFYFCALLKTTPAEYRDEIFPVPPQEACPSDFFTTK